MVEITAAMWNPTYCLNTGDNMADFEEVDEFEVE